MLILALGNSTVDVGFHGARVHGAQVLDRLCISDVHDNFTLHRGWSSINILRVICTCCQSTACYHSGVAPRWSRLMMCTIVPNISCHTCNGLADLCYLPRRDGGLFAHCDAFLYARCQAPELLLNILYLCRRSIRMLRQVSAHHGYLVMHCRQVRGPCNLPDQVYYCHNDCSHLF